jgi:glutamate/tyrosine decarboxylase-like PLP-dependent enzyme
LGTNSQYVPYNRWVPSANFALDSATRRRLGYELIDVIDAYFESLPTRPVQLPAERRSFEPLHDVIPEVGVLDELAGDSTHLPVDALAQFLRTTSQELIDQGFHVPAANYFGLMNPTPAYAAVLAEALVAAINPQLATMARSQLASKIEAETVRWIGERFGWQPPFDGTFTSGGNEANFSGLALALASRFPSAIEDGVASIGAHPVVYASEEAHHSLDKSVGLLGLGRKALRRVPVTDRIQMDIAVLNKAIRDDRAIGRKPFCVVATAGTTNSGAIDDIAAIADLCRREELWLHLDGAYGAAAAFSDKHRNLVRGIELCDSVTIDPHKWLAMPFAAGVILTRHSETLQQAFGVSTPYMPKTAPNLPTDNFKVSTQWTRRMNSLKLWLTLKLHGRRAYEQHIDRQMTLAANFADWVDASEQFEMTAPVAVPILNFRLKGGSTDDELTRRHLNLVDIVTRDGQRWISETRVCGRSVLRVMVISYLTGDQQLADLQVALKNAAVEVERAPEH